KCISLRHPAARARAFRRRRSLSPFLSFDLCCSSSSRFPFDMLAVLDWFVSPVSAPCARGVFLRRVQALSGAISPDYASLKGFEGLLHPLGCGGVVVDRWCQAVTVVGSFCFFPVSAEMVSDFVPACAVAASSWDRQSSMASRWLLGALYNGRLGAYIRLRDKGPNNSSWTPRVSPDWLK
ncbi:hypothetical protein IGI04_026446, partial [Brassica rapa subsp. trilocularis]